VTDATITTYQVYLAFHILAAVIWVGGALMLQILAIRATRAARAGEPRRLADFVGEAEWVGTRVFIPASLVLVVLGFLMIHSYHWPYRFWLIFAIAVWAGSFLTGVAFLGPQSGRLGKEIDAKGFADGGVQARIQRIFLASRIELVFLILVVLDMALKPGS
jgi:uncharacterized membrane protein